MKAFAELLSRLALTPGRNDKLAYLQLYLRQTPDPDRGLALAAMTGALSLPSAKASLVRALGEARIAPELFRISYDYVGDLAETVALIWQPAAAADGAGPARQVAAEASPRLHEVVEILSGAARADLPGIVAGWLDRSDADTRYALLKLVTGGLRVGLSARLAKQAVADYAQSCCQEISVDDIEEVWHGLSPPYGPLFAWVEGRGTRPDGAGQPLYRPAMLAHPLEDEALAALPLDEYLAEWKWDGIRVQYVRAAAGCRLFSRAGEDISAAFPELLDLTAHDCVLDGELMVFAGDEPAPFSALQKRLNRKKPSAKLMHELPAGIVLYDVLSLDGEDVRALPLTERRARLEAFVADAAPSKARLSEIVPFADAAALLALRTGARAAGREGLMLKSRASAYVAGRVKGLWWKLKRAPLSIDAVLMYAQTGHGGRGGMYSDYTFGVWDGAGALVPVGKAYSGFTAAELKKIDALVRANTVAKYGPVREVSPCLVLEVAFDSAQISSRHRAGVALRFPRIARLRWDKPVEQADTLAGLRRLAGIDP